MTQWLAQLADLPAALLNATLSLVMLLDTLPLLGILVPGDVAVLIAVGAQDPVGGWVVMLSVVGGCLAGWTMTFFAGRFFGKRIRASRVGAWIGESRWVAAERMLASGGGRMVVMSPFLPVLNTLMPLVAGGLRMPYRRFLVSAASGAALWAGMYVALGAVARTISGLLPDDTYLTAGTVVVGFAVGSVGMVGLRRKLTAAAHSAVEEVDANDADGAMIIEVPVAEARPVRVVRTVPVQRAEGDGEAVVPAIRVLVRRDSVPAGPRRPATTRRGGRPPQVGAMLR